MLGCQDCCAMHLLRSRPVRVWKLSSKLRSSPTQLPEVAWHQEARLALKQDLSRVQKLDFDALPRASIKLQQRKGWHQSEMHTIPDNKLCEAPLQRVNPIMSSTASLAQNRSAKETTLEDMAAPTNLRCSQFWKLSTPSLKYAWCLWKKQNPKQIQVSQQQSGAASL